MPRQQNPPRPLPLYRLCARPCVVAVCHRPTFRAERSCCVAWRPGTGWGAMWSSTGWPCRQLDSQVHLDSSSTQSHRHGSCRVQSPMRPCPNTPKLTCGMRRDAGADLENILNLAALSATAAGAAAVDAAALDAARDKVRLCARKNACHGMRASTLHSAGRIG